MADPNTQNRREYPRFGLKFNVILAHDERRPRGCRVLDISQGGVLVEWPESGAATGASNYESPDFVRRGDLVDVHFSAALDGCRKHFHLACQVVRTVHKQIAVAFDETDERLALLLASQRGSAIDLQDAVSSAQRPLDLRGRSKSASSSSGLHDRAVPQATNGQVDASEPAQVIYGSTLGGPFENIQSLNVAPGEEKAQGAIARPRNGAVPPLVLASALAPLSR